MTPKVTRIGTRLVVRNTNSHRMKPCLTDASMLNLTVQIWTLKNRFLQTTGFGSHHLIIFELQTTPSISLSSVPPRMMSSLFLDVWVCHRPLILRQKSKCQVNIYLIKHKAIK